MKAILNTLRTITPPRIVREAMALLGTLETPGTKSNPIIVNWAKETNTKEDDWYNTDSIPWCGLFMAVVAQRANWEVVKEPLRAKAWDKFGQVVKEAVLGDILVFSRNGGGHVGLYVGESATTYFVLGGNQGDKVSIAEISKSRIHSINRPIYKIAMPESCKKYHYASGGRLSTNEA
jgi:uncharacterized protein (TIGR02594 family)